MKYKVEFRNGWDMKSVGWFSFEEAIRMVNILSYALDLKVVITKPKKDWWKCTNDSCFFQLDYTSKRYKDNSFVYIRIVSEHIPMHLYGASITQIDKYIRCIKK